jgi:hypothetical protein
LGEAGQSARSGHKNPLVLPLLFSDGNAVFMDRRRSLSLPEVDAVRHSEVASNDFLVKEIRGIDGTLLSLWTAKVVN